jgi:DNA-nicking Smr family endonuclease
MQATLDLHGLDVASTEEVVRGVLRTLLQSRQSGELDIVTGQGNNSHNRKSNLRPLVVTIIQENGLRHQCPTQNAGMLTVLFP